MNFLVLQKNIRVFISKVVLIAIRVFRGKVFTLLLFILAFAGRSFSLWTFRSLRLFKQKSHHLLEIIDTLVGVEASRVAPVAL